MSHSEDSQSSNSDEQLQQHHSIEVSSPIVRLTAAQQAQATLDTLDNASISRFHLKTILIAGSGFMCDGYDLQCIGMLTPLIGRLYYPDWTYWPLSVCAVDPHVLAGTVPQYLTHEYQLTDKYLICGKNHGKTDGYADYTQHVPSALPLQIGFALTGVALCGTLLGQLIFGYLGDHFGRKSMFTASLAIMIVFAFMQGFTMGEGQQAVVWSLCFFRFILGVGIGGDYPLAATLMSEYGGKNNRGALISAVFAMQGTGYLLASGTCAICGAIWSAAGANTDYLWRTVLMFGAVPTLLSMHSRLSMPETPRYTLLNKGQAGDMINDMNTVIARDGNSSSSEAVAAAAAAAPVNTTVRIKTDDRSYRDFFRQYGVILIGTAGSWFLLDIAFYSQGLYQSYIYTAVGWVPASYTMTPSDEVYQLARAQTYINLASTIPGYWFTVFTVEHLGRWKIQMGGFVMMTLFMSLLAGLYEQLYYNIPAFIGLYCMTFFFANWGPNATTFVIPAEVFPSRFRTLGHGISAAAGKAGSIIGVFGFKYMTATTGNFFIPGNTSTRSLGPALGLLAGVLGLGCLTTLLVPETMGKTLEELSGDSIEMEDEESSEGELNKQFNSNSNSNSNDNSVPQSKNIDYYSSPEKQYEQESASAPALQEV